MGPVRALHFFFALLAATIPFTAVSAHDTESVLDRPEEAFSYGQPLRDNVLLFPLDAQPARNKIDGLLSLSKLWSRQQQVACSTNYTICQGTQFCCPNGNACCSDGSCCGTGTYCTTVGGVQGCCLLGHICSQVTNQCTVNGQQRCPGENFCCPTGDTCYRDGSNNPRCSSTNSLASSIMSSTSVPTSTISFVPAKPSGSATTSVPTSASLQTMCQLTQGKSNSLFSRRRLPPAHPGQKRKRWFR